MRGFISTKYRFVHVTTREKSMHVKYSILSSIYSIRPFNRKKNGINQLFRSDLNFNRVRNATCILIKVSVFTPVSLVCLPFLNGSVRLTVTSKSTHFISKMYICGIQYIYQPTQQVSKQLPMKYYQSP